MYTITFRALKYKYKKRSRNKDWGELRAYTGNSMHLCKTTANPWDFLLNCASVPACVVTLPV